jgi:hypothetical protein
MHFTKLLLAVLATALLVAAPRANAQEAPQWRPSSTAMPTMPTVAELQADWLGPLAAWFGGIDSMVGAAPQDLRATGSVRSGGSRTQIARFLRGPVPVVVMTDRNGDDRADMIEYFRGGTLVLQVIDADYNGRANALRIYDSAGALIREERL